MKSQNIQTENIPTKINFIEKRLTIGVLAQNAKDNITIKSGDKILPYI